MRPRVVRGEPGGRIRESKKQNRSKTDQREREAGKKKKEGEVKDESL